MRNLGVGAVIANASGQILLIQRRHAPQARRWAVPGGRVNPGEAFTAALIREMKEETALLVEPGPLLLVAELAGHRTKERLIVLDFGCRIHPASPPPSAGSDALALCWAGPDTWQSLPLAAGMEELLVDSRVRDWLRWA